jgi:hypothetical protein
VRRRPTVTATEAHISLPVVGTLTHSKIAVVIWAVWKSGEDMPRLIPLFAQA